MKKRIAITTLSLAVALSAVFLSGCKENKENLSDFGKSSTDDFLGSKTTGGAGDLQKEVSKNKTESIPKNSENSAESNEDSESSTLTASTSNTSQAEKLTAPSSNTTSISGASPAEKPTSPPSTITNTGGTPSDEHTPSASDKLADKFPRISEKELKAAIDKFPLSNITLPDGSVVSKYDAISADSDVLIFGFAFYRNTSPIFKTTLTDPSLITHENGFWEAAVNVKELDKEIAADYKKAAAGSVLENGLLVDGAMCRIDSNGNVTQSELCLRGSITVSGIINYLPEEDMSGSEGTLFLRFDTTKATLPVPYSSWNAVFQYWDGYKNSEDDPPFYMYFDGNAWNLGNIHDPKYNKFDLKNAFGDAKTIAAAVTVCDLSLSSMYGVHGEIIDIQL